MALSQQDRLQIRNIGLICGLVVAGLVFAPLSNQGIGIMELRKAIKSQEKLLASTQQEFNQKQTQIDRIPAIQSELENRAPEIARYEARLPKSRKVPELFRDIDRFTRRTGLTITMQRRLDPVDRPDYIELPILVEARGSFDAIVTFINLLERNQRFAQIKDFRITEIPGKSEAERQNPNFIDHDASIVVSTFMFKDQVVEEEARERAEGTKKPEPGKPAAKKPEASK